MNRCCSALTFTLFVSFCFFLRTFYAYSAAEWVESVRIKQNMCQVRMHGISMALRQGEGEPTSHSHFSPSKTSAFFCRACQCITTWPYVRKIHAEPNYVVSCWQRYKIKTSERNETCANGDIATEALFIVMSFVSSRGYVSQKIIHFFTICCVCSSCCSG